MNNKFYILKPPGLRFGNKFAYGEQMPPINTGDFVQCPICGLPVETRKWLSPRKIKISTSKSSKWGDFLWGDGFKLAVSEKFKCLYEENKLTGINAFWPLEVVKLGRMSVSDTSLSPPKYYLISINWNGANLDDERSGVVRSDKSGCYFCRSQGLKSFSGIFLEESSWNKDDIFKARGLPGEILTSERFKIFVEEYKLTSACLILSQYCSYNELTGMSYSK